MSCGEIDLKVLIVGYGNPLRGDDAVGWIAAERLERMIGDPGIQIIHDHQLMPELAEPISRAELVILIDACCDRPAGEITRRPVVATASPGGGFSHGLEPPTLLSLAQTLYGRAARTMLFSIGAESFEHGAGLSPVVQTALEELVTQVRDLAEGWVGGEHCH